MNKTNYHRLAGEARLRMTKVRLHWFTKSPGEVLPNGEGGGTVKQHMELRIAQAWRVENKAAGDAEPNELEGWATQIALCADAKLIIYEHGKVSAVDQLKFNSEAMSPLAIWTWLRMRYAGGDDVTIDRLAKEWNRFIEPPGLNWTMSQYLNQVQRVYTARRLAGCPEMQDEQVAVLKLKTKIIGDLGGNILEDKSTNPYWEIRVRYRAKTQANVEFTADVLIQELLGIEEMLQDALPKRAPQQGTSSSSNMGDESHEHVLALLEDELARRQNMVALREVALQEAELDLREKAVLRTGGG